MIQIQSRGKSVFKVCWKKKAMGIWGVANKETYTVQTTNIISLQQYFVADCLISYVDNVFGLHSIVFVFLLSAS
jgi:hypothetical protein